MKEVHTTWSALLIHSDMVSEHSLVDRTASLPQEAGYVIHFISIYWLRATQSWPKDLSLSSHILLTF